MSTLKTHNLQSPDAGSVNIVMAPNAGMVVAGLSTYSNQINVGSNIKLGSAGVVTATSFTGSGANLTSLPAANLTGALPAISGANLTGLSKQITIGVRSGAAVTFTATGSSFNVVGRSGNIPISI